MLPVLDGLLPPPHNDSILDLVFVMGCWHAYAKLRLHTEHTLASFERVTTDLGVLLRHFSMVTCSTFKTTELPRERAARLRRAANTPGPAPGPGASATGPKTKGFNLNTYKLHALGDYPQTIRERGTTDNYTTQRVGDGCLHHTAVVDSNHPCRLSLNIGAPRPSIQGSTSMRQNGTSADCTAATRSSTICQRAELGLRTPATLYLGHATQDSESDTRRPRILVTT